MIFHTYSYKIIGETLLLLPVSLLLVLGTFEVGSGDLSGVQHFIELIPFALFAYVCWYHSKNGGIILTAVTGILAVLYFLFFTRTSAAMRLVNEALLFLPLIIAGLLFYTSTDEHET